MRPREELNHLALRPIGSVAVLRGRDRWVAEFTLYGEATTCIGNCTIHLAEDASDEEIGRAVRERLNGMGHSLRSYYLKVFRRGWFDRGEMVHGGPNCPVV
jgi:hypothetical protein